MTTRTALTLTLLAAPLGLAGCGDADDPVMDEGPMTGDGHMMDAEGMPMEGMPMEGMPMEGMPMEQAPMDEPMPMNEQVPMDETPMNE